MGLKVVLGSKLNYNCRGGVELVPNFTTVGLRVELVLAKLLL